MDSTHMTPGFCMRRGALPGPALLVVLGLLCSLPALVPFVVKTTDELFLYPYIAVLDLFCAAFCVLLAHRRNGAQRKQWALLSLHFGFSMLVYVVALLGAMNLLLRVHFWVGGAVVVAARTALLMALTWSAGGSRRVKALDACMILLLPVLVFIGSYSPTYAANVPNHLYISFAGTVFLALVGTVAYVGNSSRSPVAFPYIAMVFLWSWAIDLVFTNLVNYQWLASPREMPFDLLFGIPSLLFCWLANRALRQADEPVARFRQPWMQNLMPSLLALAGVTVAPFALHDHPLLSAAFSIVLITLYIARTHLMYRRLMQHQIDLRSHAGRLEHLAASDALTGVGNRRALQDAAMALLARIPVSSAALILVDVDRFKEINDAYGHSVGDDVLQLVAEILLDEAGKIDGACCIRLGGDEFVALLPDADTSTTQELAEYVRLRVQEQCVARNLPATISVGITVSDGEWTLSSLLIDADEALYRAKSGGRNLVVPAVEIVPTREADAQISTRAFSR